MRIVVHLHLFYLEMWDDVKEYLENVDVPYRLVVTMIIKDEKLEEKIRTFHRDTVFYVVENRGFDVAAFVFFLQNINLDDYDYVIKIHTKNPKKLNSYLCESYFKKLWYERLFSGILGSKEIFVQNLNLFERDESIGMIASRFCVRNNFFERNYFSKFIYNRIYKNVSKIMKRLSLFCPKYIEFVAGTMFIAKISVFKELRNVYSINDFCKINSGVSNGTLAHYMERVLGAMVLSKGYKIKGVGGDNFLYKSFFIFYGYVSKHSKFAYLFIKYFFNKIYPIIFTNKFTDSGRHIIKIFKIPVYNKKCK